MRALLGIVAASLLTVAGCGAIIVNRPPDQPSYTAQELLRQAAALEQDTPELRLPYVDGLRVPAGVYADEAFTIGFDVAADDAPELLIERALPPLALQVETSAAAGYAGQLTVGPWLLAVPPPPVAGEPDEALRTVDITLRLNRPGTYVLVCESADKPEHGGRPARYTENGVEFTRGEVAIRRRELRLVVYPSRQPAVQPRFYNEPYCTLGTSGSTWDYGNWQDWERPARPHRALD